MPVEAKVRIVAENATATAFASILTDANALSGKMREAFSAAFVGLSAAGLWEGIKGAIEYGDAIGKAAQKSGMASEAFSQLAYAAKRTDVDIAALSKGLKAMQVGISEGKDIFEQIGVPIEKLRALKPDVQFDAIASAIARIKDPADKTAAAVAIFGKAGADLLPLLERGAGGVEAFRIEADKLGLTLGPDAIEKFEKSKEAIDKMDASFTRLWQTLALKTGPAIAHFFDLLRIGLGGGTDIEKLNKQLDDLVDARNHLQGQILLGNISQARANPYALQIEQQIAEVQAKIKAASADPANVTAADAVLGTPQAAKEKTTKVLAAIAAESRARMEQLRAAVGESDLFAKDLELKKKALDEAEKLTETSTEKELADWQKFMDALELLRANDLISEHEYQQRKLAELDRVFPVVELRSKIQVQQFKKGADDMTEFARQAARNMQDAFANFLFDPFKDGIRGMLLGFINTIRQMLAQAASAKIFEALGLGESKSGGGGTGILGSILGAVFGGGGGSAGTLSSGYTASLAAAEGATFATGGAFTVGGSGGTDSQHVAFRATPGERVSITRPGDSGNGPAIHITTSIDARGASTDLVAALPGILKRHGEAVKADVLDGLRRRRYPV